MIHHNSFISSSSILIGDVPMYVILISISTTCSFGMQLRLRYQTLETVKWVALYGYPTIYSQPYLWNRCNWRFNSVACISSLNSFVIPVPKTSITNGPWVVRRAHFCWFLSKLILYVPTLNTFWCIYGCFWYCDRFICILTTSTFCFGDLKFQRLHPRRLLHFCIPVSMIKLCRL